MIYQNVKCLKEIVLDSTDVPLSGIAYIFMVLINENFEMLKENG